MSATLSVAETAAASPASVVPSTPLTAEAHANANANANANSNVNVDGDVEGDVDVVVPSHPTTPSEAGEGDSSNTSSSSVRSITSSVLASSASNSVGRSLGPLSAAAAAAAAAAVAAAAAAAGGGAAGAASKSSSRDPCFVSLCQTLNIDSMTAQRAWAIFSHTNSVLSAGDTVKKTRWCAFAVYVASHPSLLAVTSSGGVEGSAAVRGGEVAAAAAGTAAGAGAAGAAADGACACVSINSIVRATDLTPIRFFEEMLLFARDLALDTSAIELSRRQSRNGSLGSVVLRHSMQRLRMLEVDNIVSRWFTLLFDSIFPKTAASENEAVVSSVERRKSPSRKAKTRVTIDVTECRRLIQSFAWTLHLIMQEQSGLGASAQLAQSDALMVCCVAWCYANAKETDEFVNAQIEGGAALLRSVCERHHAQQAQPHGSFASFYESVCVVNDTIFRPVLGDLIASYRLSVNEEDLSGAFFADAADSGNSQLRSPSLRLEQNSKKLRDAYESVLLSVGLTDQRALMDAPVSEKMFGNSHSLHALALLKNLVVCEGPATACPKPLVQLAREKSSTTLPLEQLQKEVVTWHRKVVEFLEDGALADLTARFFYKLLDAVVRNEMKNKASSFSALICSKEFTLSLFSCSAELVLFAAQSDIRFPTISSALGASVFEMQKVFEPVIRAENGLSSALIKHLGSCERSAIQELVWKDGSDLRQIILQDSTSPLNTTTSSSSGGAASSADASILSPLAGQRVRPRSVQVFLRKVHALARLRTHQLCEHFEIDEPTRKRISCCLYSAIEHNNHQLLFNRHLDQIVMCSIFAVCFVSENKVRFNDLVAQYSALPHAELSTITRVPLSKGFGDIVAFYNEEFVPALKGRVKELLARPSPDELYLSLPDFRVSHSLGARVVSCTTPLTVSSISSPPSSRRSTLSPRISYAFSQSPAQMLVDINKCIRRSSDGLRGPPIATLFSSPRGKRGDDFDDSAIAKRIRTRRGSSLTSHALAMTVSAQDSSMADGAGLGVRPLGRFNNDDGDEDFDDYEDDEEDEEDDE